MLQATPYETKACPLQEVSHFINFSHFHLHYAILVSTPEANLTWLQRLPRHWCNLPERATVSHHRWLNLTIEQNFAAILIVQALRPLSTTPANCTEANWHFHDPATSPPFDCHQRTSVDRRPLYCDDATAGENRRMISPLLCSYDYELILLSLGMKTSPSSPFSFDKSTFFRFSWTMGSAWGRSTLSS